MKIVMTGGHHSSALPVIQKFLSRVPENRIFWFGHRFSLKNDKNTSLEYREITALNIPFYEVKTGKIYKSLNIKNIIKVINGILQCYRILKELKPDLIVSFGGYIAVPVVVAGWLLKIPSITHEQTSVVGYANRVIALFANRILISWKHSAKYFNRKKVIFTGLPLRESIYTIQSNEFEFTNELPVIFILAGKSGSTAINNVVKQCLRDLLNICNIIHQTGDYSEDNNYEELSTLYAQIRDSVPAQYYPNKFIQENEIGEAYAKSDLVVARSGAHTISEILALHKTALLIPIEDSSHNEQMENAKLVKDSGMAEILEQKDLTPGNFKIRLQYMLHNLKSYKNTTTLNIKELSSNAADLILAEIMNYEKRQI